ncbi:tetratricopeptide repeat protein [Acidobacteriota bacterium]
MNQQKKMIAAVIFLVGASFLYSNLMPGESAKELYEKALYLEETKGELKKAIEVYDRIVKEYSDERDTAAKAQLHIGFCYEKLGFKEAQNAFQMVIKNYPDQNDSVKLAKAKLAVLMKSGISVERQNIEFRLSKIWSDESVDSMGRPSPDGHFISMVDWDTGDLAVRDLEAGKNRSLTNKGTWEDSDEFAMFSIWSPDGKFIAYYWFNTDDYFDLRIYDFEKGEYRILNNDVGKSISNLYDWSNDGKKILILRSEKGIGSEFGLVSIEDGAFTPLLKFESPPSPMNASFSPDGRYVVYEYQKTPTNSDIMKISLGDKTVAPLIDSPAFDSLIGWAPEGERLIFSSNRSGRLDMWVLQLKDGRPTEEPILLHPDIGQIRPLGIADDGSLFYYKGKTLFNVYTTELEDDGTLSYPPKKIRSHFEGKNTSSFLSPDGRMLAYLTYRGPETPSSIWRANTICLLDMVSQESRELSLDLIVPTYERLRWSQDNRSLFFLAAQTIRGSGISLYQLNIETGEVPTLLVPDKGFSIRAHNPEGNTVILSRFDRDDDRMGRNFYFFHDLKSGEQKELHSVAGRSAFDDLSPDGRFHSFITRDEDKANKLVILPIDGGNPRELFVADEDSRFWTHTWSQDGSLIFLTSLRTVSKNKTVSELWRVPLNGDAAEKIDLLKEFNSIQHVSYNPGTGRLAFTARQSIYDVWKMENFLKKK